MQRQKDQMGPCQYLKQISNAKQKSPLPRSEDAIPERTEAPGPAPFLGQALDDTTTDEFPVEAESAPRPKEPTDINFAPLTAMVAPISVPGDDAATNVSLRPAPQNEGPPTLVKEKAPRGGKRRRSTRNKDVEDFEDYRNLSPKSMPLPPKADTPAVKRYPPTGPEYVGQRSTQSVSMTSIKQLEGYYREREGLSF